MALKYMLQQTHRLTEISYCINCLDKGSLITGTFAYDEELFDMGMGMWAISPIFKDVDRFYIWAKEQGFLYHSTSKSFVMSRDFS